MKKDKALRLKKLKHSGFKGIRDVMPNAQPPILIILKLLDGDITMGVIGANVVVCIGA